MLSSSMTGRFRGMKRRFKRRAAGGVSFRSPRLVALARWRAAFRSRPTISAARGVEWLIRQSQIACVSGSLFVMGTVLRWAKSVLFLRGAHGAGMVGPTVACLPIFERAVFGIGGKLEGYHRTSRS